MLPSANESERHDQDAGQQAGPHHLRERELARQAPQLDGPGDCPANGNRLPVHQRDGDGGYAGGEIAHEEPAPGLSGAQPSFSATASWTGAASKAPHTKQVAPAQKAVLLKSLRNGLPVVCDTRDAGLATVAPGQVTLPSMASSHAAVSEVASARARR